MPSLMDSYAQGIGELIEQKQALRVPDHQRDFAWTGPEEVDEFFSDITGAMSQGLDEYFLGLLVLVRPADEGQWRIVDGQQRLATTTMIYSAIRTWLRSRGKDPDASSVQDRFIGVRPLGASEYQPRLTLNISNRASFEELVVGEQPASVLQDRFAHTGRYSSERKLVGAMIACRNLVDAYAARGATAQDEQAQRLYALAGFVRDNVKVIVMEVDSPSTAYVIFETLNDRGLDLSVLDLVKNHIFGRAGGSLDEVQANWVAMTTNLGDRPKDDFLKTWWTSGHGRVQRGNLFAEWRKQYDSVRPAEVVDVGRVLVRSADRYAALDVPDHDVWSSFSDKTSYLLRELITLGHTQVKPLLLAGLDKLSEAEVERLMVLMRSFIVRYSLVGQRRTGAFEIAVAKAALGVTQGSLNSPRKIWDEVFSGLVPGDADFKEDFLDYRETKSARGRYVLSQLEIVARAAAKGAMPDLRPWDELTLEHILPRNPSNEWKATLAADSDLKDLGDSIGNLCLLQGKLGRGVGSKAFAAKKEEYAKSDLLLTSTIAAEPDWSSEALRKRQQQLSTLAANAWPLP